MCIGSVETTAGTDFFFQSVRYFSMYDEVMRRAVMEEYVKRGAVFDFY